MKHLKLALLIVLVTAALGFGAAGVGFYAWTEMGDSLSDNDLIGITDTSDTTQSDNGTSKKATLSQVFSYIIGKIDADDIDDTSTTSKFVTASDITNLANLSGTNTGDQTLPTAATLAITDGNSFYTTDYLDNAMDQISGVLSGLGTASTRAAEDTMTDGPNLPDGAAIIAYAAANGWGTGGSMVYPSALNFGYTADGSSWSTMTLSTLLGLLDDETWTFTNPITAPAISVGATATPGLYLRDSDSGDADQGIVNIFADATTTTAGAVVSDLTFQYKDGGDASGAYTDAFWIDGSANTVKFEIPTTFPAGDIAVEEVESDLKTHELVVTKEDVSATDTGNYVRIPTGAEWQSAYSWCDASESALVYTVYYSATLGGSFSSLGTIAHDAAAATDTADISSWTDPVAGGWVHIDVSTAGTGATTCHLALSLLGN